MNGSTLKILMALGIGHLAIASSSEAGKKNRKARQEEKNALEKKQSAEHSSQSEQAAEQKAPPHDDSEAQEDEVKPKSAPQEEAEEPKSAPQEEAEEPKSAPREEAEEPKSAPQEEAEEPKSAPREEAEERVRQAEEEERKVKAETDRLAQERKDAKVKAQEEEAARTALSKQKNQESFLEFLRRTEDPAEIALRNDPNNAITLQSQGGTFKAINIGVLSSVPVNFQGQFEAVEKMIIRAPAVSMHSDEGTSIKADQLIIDTGAIGTHTTMSDLRIEPGKKSPVAASKDPVGENKEHAQSNAAPQNAEESAPSARMTEEQIEEAFKEIGRIQNAIKDANVAAQLMMTMKDLTLSSFPYPETQRDTLTEMVQNTCASFSLPHDLIKRREAFLAAIKAEESFYTLECTRNKTDLTTQVEALRKTTGDLNTRASLDWHVEEIKKLEAKKAEAQSLLQKSKVLLPKMLVRVHHCKDENEKSRMQIQYNIANQIAKELPKNIEQLGHDIKDASDLKATFMRVAANEKELKSLESRITAATSETEKTKLESEKAAIETSLIKDTMNAYYEDVNKLKSEQVQQENKKRRIEEMLKNSTKQKEFITNYINFYELEWADYMKLINEKTQIERCLEVEKELSQKQAMKIGTLQIEQSNLKRTIKGINEEMESWKSNKKKRGIFSKLNPFKLFKRKHKHTEE